ncbi:MAG: hypothetical protein ACLFWF_10185 [Alphaproteobacteria bacterium]
MRTLLRKLLATWLAAFAIAGATVWAAAAEEEGAEPDKASGGTGGRTAASAPPDSEAKEAK